VLNIDTLDTVIALVVVILLLSLIVQAIQGVLKKLLKLKSKEIEDSLLDLFNAVLRDTSKAPAPDAPSSRPRKIRPACFAKSPAPVNPAATELLEAVKREMRELGRLSARGNFMADSLSKGDLLNIMARVAPNAIGGGDLGTLIGAFQQLEATVAAVQAEELPADVSVLWAKFRGTLVPLKQHYTALTNGTGTVAPGVIVADVLKLRGVVFDDSLDLLAKVQAAVAGKNVPGLDEKKIAAISASIAAARDVLDTSFGAFQSKLAETEQWFDTTMQSFEERYHRGMRTVSLMIAACVVVLLNADVFSLYRNISRNELLRNDLVNAAPDIVRLQKEIAAAEAKGPDTGSEQQELAKDRKELDRLVQRYTDFGLEPLTWDGMGEWLGGLAPGDVAGTTWWSRRRGDVRTLFGWILMTLLLSLGAPFWHDALESLFGVKNLLRKRNEQQNVEQAAGAGNPKP
jgi:hypothetical protein